MYLKFSNNVEKNGGALFLDSNSIMILNAISFGIYISINFVNDTAHKGGAIFVKDIIILFRVDHFQSWINIMI